MDLEIKWHPGLRLKDATADGLIYSIPTIENWQGRPNSVGERRRADNAESGIASVNAVMCVLDAVVDGITVTVY